MFYRHGDVIIKKIDSIKGNRVKDNLTQDIILAEGEVTGHAHRIKTGDGEVKLFEKQGILYLKVLSKKATITHEEHKPIEIPEGLYEINIQREYEPQGWRQVKD